MKVSETVPYSHTRYAFSSSKQEQTTSAPKYEADPPSCDPRYETLELQDRYANVGIKIFTKRQNSTADRARPFIPPSKIAPEYTRGTVPRTKYGGKKSKCS